MRLLFSQFFFLNWDLLDAGACFAGKRIQNQI